MTHQNLLFRLKALGLISISALASAQYDGRVGINTDTPKATLDLRPNPDNALATATTNEGLLIPKLSKARVANIATPEEATMVYVGNLIYTGTDPRVSGIISPGFYYYDAVNGKWKKLNMNPPTGLEKITENGNTGWRLIGRDPNNYGDIGEGAIDFSHSTSPSNENGATGEKSFAFGTDAKATGIYSFAIGDNTEAKGEYSEAIGRNTYAVGPFSKALFGGTAIGHNSIAIDGTAEGSNSYAVFNAYTASTATGSIAIGAVVTEPHIIAIGGADIYAGIGPSYSKVAIGNLLYLEKDLKMKANALGDCDANTIGTIKFDGTNFHGCTPSGWKQLNN
ncbi:MAG: hypothetical protein ACTTJM_03685 [Bergeyella cardium]